MQTSTQGIMESGIRIRRYVPATEWLRTYARPALRRDLLAGITLAAYLVPGAIGDASLAGLAPEAGLYACLFSGLTFWLFCSSRHTAISVTSAMSLLMGSTLGSISGGDTMRFGALAAATALLMAGIAFLAWLIRAGAVVRFISEGVLVGFKCGVALFLASTQLPKLCGFHGAHGDFWENCAGILKFLPATNVPSLAIGGAALVVLIAGKLWAPKAPVSLLVVVGGILAASLAGLEARGVQLLGDVPKGLPQPGLPSVTLSELNQLLPLAFACFMLGAVETAAIGRMFLKTHGGRLDADQEFLALAVANLAAGLGRGFPVSGGMSQSVVNEGAGAQSPLSGGFAALLMLIVVLFLSPLLRTLPQPVLAAVVLVAVVGLFNLSALRKFWRCERLDFVVAVVALLGVLGSGLLHGVMIGAIISLVLLIRRASRPHVALLGRIAGTRHFSDVERHRENELIPGIMILRPESSLLYFNADHVHDHILQRVAAAQPRPDLVILDLSTTPWVDLQSAHSLILLSEELARLDVRVQVVEAHSRVRDRLRQEDAEMRLGEINRAMTVADALEKCRVQKSAATAHANENT